MIQGSFKEKFQVLVTSLSKDKDSAETKQHFQMFFYETTALALTEPYTQRLKILMQTFQSQVDAARRWPTLFISL